MISLTSYGGTRFAGGPSDSHLGVNKIILNVDMIKKSKVHSLHQAVILLFHVTRKDTMKLLHLLAFLFFLPSVTAVSNYARAMALKFVAVEKDLKTWKLIGLIASEHKDLYILTCELQELEETFKKAKAVLEWLWLGTNECRDAFINKVNDPALVDIFLSTLALSIHTASLQTNYLINFCLQKDDLCGLPEDPLVSLEIATSQATEAAMFAYAVLEQNVYPPAGLCMDDCAP